MFRKIKTSELVRECKKSEEGRQESDEEWTEIEKDTLSSSEEEEWGRSTERHPSG